MWTGDKQRLSRVIKENLKGKWYSQEKKFYAHGLINGGVYIIDKKHFEEKNLGTQFSFEKDYLERFVFEKLFFGFETANYFIDIGVPEDYAQAQIDFVKTEN